MTADIAKWEAASKTLEPDEAGRKELVDAAWHYTNEFIKTMEGGPVYNEDFSDLTLLDDTRISDDPMKVPDLIRLIKKAVDGPGLNPAHAGHLGYIPGGGIFASGVGDYLAAVINKYAGLYFSAPGAVKVENQLIRWSAKLIGFPETALGNITSGGSIANLIAITTARDAKRITPETIGQTVIYFSQQTHHCVQKAVRIAGLAQCQFREIALDDSFRMDASDLRKRVIEDERLGLRPFYIAASCGSTDTGAVDPFEEIADIAEEHDLWFHVDGAYGGYFALLDELKSEFNGIERAHSVVLDPHKSLFLPYGSGIVLIREGKKLFESFHYMANYLQDIITSEEEVAPADLSPELTKHFRGLRMWLPLKLHGVAPFRACLREKILLTQYFYNEVQKLGFEVGPRPQLTVSIYRYLPENGSANEFNGQLVKEIKSDGRLFVSSTTIGDTFWIRIAVVNFRTHRRHIDLFLSVLKELVEKLKSEDR